MSSRRRRATSHVLALVLLGLGLAGPALAQADRPGTPPRDPRLASPPAPWASGAPAPQPPATGQPRLRVDEGQARRNPAIRTRKRGCTGAYGMGLGGCDD